MCLHLLFKLHFCLCALSGCGTQTFFRYRFIRIWGAGKRKRKKKKRLNATSKWCENTVTAISHLLDFGAALPRADEGAVLGPPPVPRFAQAFSFGGGAGITFSCRAPWLGETGGRDPGEVGSSTSFSECSLSWCLEPTHTHTHTSDLISDVQNKP